MELTHFKAEHLQELVKQPKLAYMREYAESPFIKTLEPSPYSFTGKIRGEVVVCGGVAEIWSGRGEAWAIISHEHPHAFIAVHRAAEKLLDTISLNRVEATVDVHFKAGHTWAKMLGFECEAPLMKSYRPSGLDSSLYARVK